MAVLAWQTVATTDKDGESAVNENLVDEFHDNQEALITGPIDCRFDEMSESSGTPSTVTEEVFIPEACKTANGDCELVVRFEKKISSTAVGAARFTLGAGSPVATANFSNSSYDTLEIRIAAADVLAVAGTVATLFIEVWRVSGTGSAFVRNNFSSSRIERIA